MLTRRTQKTKYRLSTPCGHCRVRRRHCNTSRPCDSCLELGLDCFASLNSRNAPIPAPNTLRGGEAFKRFVRQVELILPADKFPQMDLYWTQGIFQHAQSSSTLLDVVLCKTIINEIAPESPVPKAAIQYYTKSLMHPVKSDIRLLMMVSNMYLEVEIFLLHRGNSRMLVSGLFSILYSSRAHIESKYRMDELFYSTAFEFMRLVVEILEEVRIMPSAQWSWLYKFLTQLSNDLNHPEKYRLELQMFDLLYQLGQREIDATNLGWKINTWQHKLKEYAKRASHISSDNTFFTQISRRWRSWDLWWHSYLWWTFQNESAGAEVRHIVEEQMSHIESSNMLKKYAGNAILSRVVNRTIIPGMLVCIWHVRDQGIAERCAAVFERYRPWLDHPDKLIGYFRYLASTDFNKRTELEEETFGPNHQFFLSSSDLYTLALKLSEDPCPPSLRRFDVPRVIDLFEETGFGMVESPDISNDSTLA